MGVVGLVTPWNNPVAIPVGKIAPALAFGNAVVWKPAWQAPRSARLVVESLVDAGVPEGLVNLVQGDGDTAREIFSAQQVDAVSVTGSASTGATAAALCARHGKPLQAELGGNNAAVVLADADFDRVAPGLAMAAFGFAGQRCTAIRRLVVERAALDGFLEPFLSAVAALRVGDPDDPETAVGPLISLEHRRRVEAAVSFGMEQGGVLLCGGGAPPGLEDGAYLAPTLITDLGPEADLVHQETFGPVAILQIADEFADALRLLDDVSQGLVAAVCTRDPAKRRHFAGAARAGILNLVPGALAVHPDAPFGGWKASGIGPPEHGRWDREFYSRPQAVYDESSARESRS
jgi:acyl-CoA reductase-like NAD-dependent aldehyde dehydrogenase